MDLDEVSFVYHHSKGSLRVNKGSGFCALYCGSQSTAKLYLFQQCKRTIITKEGLTTAQCKAQRKERGKGGKIIWICF